MAHNESPRCTTTGVGSFPVSTGTRGRAQHAQVGLRPHDGTAGHPPGADRGVRVGRGRTGLVRGARWRHPARIGQGGRERGGRGEPGVGQRGADGHRGGRSRDGRPGSEAGHEPDPQEGTGSPPHQRGRHRVGDPGRGAAHDAGHERGELEQDPERQPDRAGQRRRGHDRGQDLVGPQRRTDRRGVPGSGDERTRARSPAARPRPGSEPRGAGLERCLMLFDDVCMRMTVDAGSDTRKAGDLGCGHEVGGALR